jgi:hypothetical protein
VTTGQEHAHNGDHHLHLPLVGVGAVACLQLLATIAFVAKYQRRQLWQQRSSLRQLHTVAQCTLVEEIAGQSTDIRMALSREEQHGGMVADAQTPHEWNRKEPPSSHYG